MYCYWWIPTEVAAASFLYDNKFQKCSPYVRLVIGINLEKKKSLAKQKKNIIIKYYYLADKYYLNKVM